MSEERWVEVHRSMHPRGGDERLLVLEARGIAARLEFTGDYYAILVPEAEAARARDELGRYVAENPPKRRISLPPLHGGALLGALGYVGLLTAAAAGSTHALFGRDWYAAGVLDGAAFRSGEWWRAATALTLHADLAHLSANLGFGLLFGVPVGRLLGPGRGWAAIAAAGILADAFDGLLMPAGHAALGASTAVFAALGILGSRGRAALGVGRGRAYRLAGVVAAAVLLAFLGTGDATTDIVGHALGFVVGLATGTLLGRRIRPASLGSQRGYGAAVLLAFVLAWCWALVSAP